MNRIYEGSVGTAKRCRAVLKKKFPKTKFSVHSHKYAGGCSVDIRWVDGPLTEEVEPLVKVFASATFDGMIDLKEHRQVPGLDEKGELVDIVGADYVFCQREMSKERKGLIEEELKTYWAEPELKEILTFQRYREYAEAEKRLIAAGRL